MTRSTPVRLYLHEWRRRRRECQCEVIGGAARRMHSGTMSGRRRRSRRRWAGAGCSAGSTTGPAHVSGCRWRLHATFSVLDGFSSATTLHKLCKCAIKTKQANRAPRGLMFSMMRLIVPPVKARHQRSQSCARPFAFSSGVAPLEQDDNFGASRFHPRLHLHL